MIFRAGPDGKIPGAVRTERKHAMRELIHMGTPVGLLAYSDGEPVAWCSVGPRATFRGLVGVGQESELV
jgi:hypothetical protein